MARVYYNDNDPFAAAWLRELIKAGCLPDGEIDERSILDVRPDDLRPYRQCHFFAGIGGWAYALALAGWPDDREVWTGSCPCQPFSVAGQGKADNDDRDLWPAFHRLVAERRPSTIFGEQTSGKLGHQWLAGVRSQMERSGYRVGAACLPACVVGAPHRRERLFWVADAAHGNDAGAVERGHREGISAAWNGGQPVDGDATGLVADAENVGHERSGEARRRRDGPENAGGSAGLVADAGRAGRGERAQRDGGAAQSGERASFWDDASGRSDAGLVADAARFGSGWGSLSEGRHVGDGDDAGRDQAAGAFALCDETGFWSDAEWLVGRDGKARRVGHVEPYVCLVVNGLPGHLDAFGSDGSETIPLLVKSAPNRVGLLRGYGNSIVPPLAAEFVRAVMEALD